MNHKINLWPFIVIVFAMMVMTFFFLNSNRWIPKEKEYEWPMSTSTTEEFDEAENN